MDLPDGESRSQNLFATIDQKGKETLLPDSRTGRGIPESVQVPIEGLGTSVRILRPEDSIDADRAIWLLKRHCEKHNLRRPSLREVAYAWIDRFNEQHRSISLLDCSMIFWKPGQGFHRASAIPPIHQGEIQGLPPVQS
jgi:hypothetical protein